MRPGLWDRGGYYAGTGFKRDHEFDVSALSNVTNGDVHAYAVLMSGAGIGAGGISAQSDLSVDSAIWDQNSNTANGLYQLNMN